MAQEAAYVPRPAVSSAVVGPDAAAAVAGAAGAGAAAGSAAGVVDSESVVFSAAGPLGGGVVSTIGAASGVAGEGSFAAGVHAAASAKAEAVRKAVRRFTCGPLRSLG
jgi:hypothetical protein